MSRRRVVYSWEHGRWKELPHVRVDGAHALYKLWVWYGYWTFAFVWMEI